MYKVVEITGKLKEYRGYEIKGNDILTFALIAGLIYILMRSK